MTTKALANLTREQLEDKSTWVGVYDALVRQLNLKPKRKPKVTR